MNDRQPALDEIEELAPRSLAYGTYFVSPLGKQHGATTRPFILYGHDALDAAAFFARATTLSTLAVTGVPSLEQALEASQPVGIFAMSRAGHPGEAAEAIKLFRRHVDARQPCLYGAWTLDVDEAAQRAVEAEADGVVMPDSDAAEMFAYLFRIFEGIDEGYPVPTEPRELVDGLKLAFPESPFWFRRNDGPVREY